eukprot:gb/GECH01012902.1/.p1 GENE.gb/GECH01012902.1/~~gb/GECH01012902.1/.p1  ORF type:complete len:118 (+),score=29.74 gb/GECH01012902.1/:1-354(+)
MSSEQIPNSNQQYSRKQFHQNVDRVHQENCSEQTQLLSAMLMKPHNVSSVQMENARVNYTKCLMQQLCPKTKQRLENYKDRIDLAFKEDGGIAMCFMEWSVDNGLTNDFELNRNESS